jgi:hypothetical protein
VDQLGENFDCPAKINAILCDSRPPFLDSWRESTPSALKKLARYEHSSRQHPLANNHKDASANLGEERSIH